MQVSNIFKTSHIKNIDGIEKQQPYQDYSALLNNPFEDTCIFSENSTSSIQKDYETIKKQQGIIGKCWDGLKNILGLKSGSKNVEKLIKQAKKGEIPEEEARKAIEKYKAGQNMCVDVVADIASGILAVTAFALAVPTGGASLAIGLGAATAAGSGVKVGIKSLDAFLTGKEYSSKDLIHDTITGAVNGLLAPVTNGIGASLTKTIGKKLGLTIIQEGATNVAAQGAKQAISSVILTQSVDVAGGTIAQRAIALGAGMAVDGALSGASDNMVRAALNGDDVIKAGVQGAVGGAIAAPIIGGGFRMASKAGKALNNKITTKRILPDGLNTKFKQGSAGDCALLSTIDGLMSNPDTAHLIKNAVTKTAGGDYNVKIGDTIVKVAKDSLSDEILSDTTGIKIFEQAYKQIAGDLDGGFAEVVAKQFGLNPVHIPGESITDEIIEQLAKEQNNCILSFGSLVDTDGSISSLGGQRHYFTIKNIDADSKTFRLTSPVDTSKTIELSFDDVKALGLSIDGGTVKKSNLPEFSRTHTDVKFRGIDVSGTKDIITKELGCSEAQFNQIIKDLNLSNSSISSLDSVASILELNGISPKEFAEAFNSILAGEAIEDFGEVAMYDILKSLEVYRHITESSIFDSFSLSLADVNYIREAVGTDNGIQQIYDLLLTKNKAIAEKYQSKNIIEALLGRFKNSIDDAVYGEISPNDIVDLGIINGRTKKVLFPDAGTVPSAKIPKGQQTEIMKDFIKSNLLTKDIADIIAENGTVTLPQKHTIRIVPSANSQPIIVEINPNDLLKQLRENGIDSLSSHDIHALTDCFKSLYAKNKNFQTLINKNIKLTDAKYKNIFNYLAHMKGMADSVLAGTNVSISDHTFMRMLDRNMISVTDNSTLKLLSFKDFIKLLAENAAQGKDFIEGYNGGIKMLIKQEGGKVIIDSVM